MSKQKRFFSDEIRVKKWFQLVNYHLIAAERITRELAGRALCRRIRIIAKIALRWDEKEAKKKLGSEGAWRFWHEGKQTPNSAFRDAVDRVLIKLGQPPIRFVLCRPGEVDLVPVWGWATSHSKLEPDMLMHANAAYLKIWPQLSHMPHQDRMKILSAALWPIFRNDSDIINGVEWPPIVLLPTSLSVLLEQEAESELPHLALSPEPDEEDSPYCLKFMVEEFASWSITTGKHMSGEIWHERLLELPGQPFAVPERVESLGYGGGSRDSELVALINDAKTAFTAFFP